jgi:signal transduction histidine kinase/DNA-binding response OmpR family regulator
MIGVFSKPSPRFNEIRLTLRQLQAETILLTLPGLYIVVFILIAGVVFFEDTYYAGMSVLILFILPVLVWLWRESNYLASAWTLVLGCLGSILLVAWGGNIHAAIFLLVLPVGLAALFVSVPGGALFAAVCSLLLLLLPMGLGPTLQGVLLIGMWGTVGLIWLTQRSFSTAIEWYYYSYEQNRQLLEQAQDAQLQLKQTLEDFERANLQLARLNDMAQGLRRAAEESRMAKEQFVANVSHELRTPLNMIVGFSETIMQSPDIYGGHIPPKLLADLDVIHRNSQHLSKLIDDVLDLSQIEAEQVALTKERVSFANIVEASIIAVRPLYESKDLSLETEIAADLPRIYCDPTRIRQVLINLLTNAGRFTEEGGVHLRVYQEKDNLVVTVTDTGPGIAAENIGKLFQPFRQVDGSIRRRYGGTGLGLSICKRFVELHGGKIWIESEEGRGTTFSFQIPVDLPPPMDSSDVMRGITPDWEFLQRTRPSMAPKPVVRPRFVVVETGDALQRLLSRYMEGVEVVSVNNLTEAIQELSAVPARALLINDMSMRKALQRLEESEGLPYGIPAITCSVPGIDEIAGGLGASDYLVKPVSAEQLLAALDRLELQGKTVLIIDDEPDTLRLFRRMLLQSERGYRILRVEDGQQGLRILREQGADVILLDLMMPQMDGFRFLAKKSQDEGLRDIPVVVISAEDPAGQPIVSNLLAVTRGGGLPVPQLLTCIDLLSRILTTTGQVDGPVLTKALSD